MIQLARPAKSPLMKRIRELIAHCVTYASALPGLQRERERNIVRRVFPSPSSVLSLLHERETSVAPVREFMEKLQTKSNVLGYLPYNRP